MYKKDHWDVLKVLASDLPKRPQMSTSDIVDTGFKRRDNADRVVRNAFRMLRKEGHIEIADRGMYRITQKGASHFKKAEEEGFKPKAATPRKATKKKAAKKSTKKATTKKKAPAKKTAKRPASKKKAPAKKAAKKQTAKPKAKKPAAKSKTKKPIKAKRPSAPKSSAKGGNGVSKKKSESKTAEKPVESAPKNGADTSATLSF